jgi:hypothetical protein
VRSCLFATVAMHAYHRQRLSYHHLFLALSVLCGATDDALQRVLYTLASRAACLLVLNDMQRAVDAGRLWLLWLPAAAGCLFCLEHTRSRDSPARPLLSALCHAAAVAGAHLLLLWAL